MLKELMRTAFAGIVRQMRTVKGHRLTETAFAKWICGNGVAIATLRDGPKAIVPIKDWTGRGIYLWGEHDPRVTSVARAVVQPGDTVLDIGANLGAPGLSIASMVGSQGKVHLFEPQPNVAQFLRTSIMINGFSQAILHEVALSDKSGCLEMEVAGSGSDELSLTHLVDARAPSVGRRISVLGEEAGEYVKRLGCRHVSLIKIDVEGHEPPILRSLRGSILDLGVGVVLFECHLRDGKFWEQESVQCLAEMGFQFMAFDMKRICSTRLYPVTRDKLKPAGYDFVAVRVGELSDASRKNLEAMAAPYGLNWR